MVEEPKHVAKDYYIGNTHIRIATDCCENVTREEAERRMRRAEATALRAWRAAELKRLKGKPERSPAVLAPFPQSGNF